MTPERKRALQWFHDRGEVKLKAAQEGRPSWRMISIMIADCDLAVASSKYGMGGAILCLTDKGRRMLHGDAE